MQADLHKGSSAFLTAALEWFIFAAVACGNNSVRRDALQSAPQALAHPGSSGIASSTVSHGPRDAAQVREVVRSASAEVTAAKSRVKSAVTVGDVDRAVSDARAAMGRARRAGDQTEVKRLERELSDLLNEAKKKTGEIETLAAVTLIVRARQDALLDRLAPKNLGMSLRPEGNAAGQGPAAGFAAAGLSAQELKKVQGDVKRYEETIAFCATTEEVDGMLADAQRLVDDTGEDLLPNQAHSLRDRLANVQKAAERQRHAVELLGFGSAQHVDYASLGLVGADDTFAEAVLDAWTAAYVEGGVAGDLVTFNDGNFVYLFDTSGAHSEEGSAARLVGVLGRTSDNPAPRDAARIRHHEFAADHVDEVIDRGHAIAHQLGGSDEGFNLFGQLAEVNRAGLWRHLESDLSKKPGSFVFVRPVYTDATDRPSAVEHGHVTDNGERFVAYFSNRSQW